MAEQTGTLERIAESLAKALGELSEIAQPANLVLLLSELGIDSPPDLSGDAQLAQSLDAVVTSATELAPRVEQLILAAEEGGALEIVTAGEAVLAQCTAVEAALDGVGTRLAAALATTPGGPELAAELAKRVVNDLIVRYLDTEHPLLRRVLTLAAVLDWDVITPETDDTVGLVRRRLHIERLPKLLSDPLDLLKSGYGWGQDDFNASRLLRRISELFEPLEPIAAFGYVDEPPVPPVLDFGIFTLVPAATAPPGLTGELFHEAAENAVFTLAQLSERSKVVLSLGGKFRQGLTMELLPPTKLDFTSPPGGLIQGDISLAFLSRSPDPDAALLIFGKAGGSRLQAREVKAGLLATLEWDGTSKAKADVGFEARFVGGKLVIDTSKSDGFLQKVVPAGGINADFDFALGWTAGRGFFFRGSSGLEVRLATHITLGPVSLEAITLGAKVEARRIPVSVGADLKVELGPLVAVVENMGVTTTFSFPPDNSGNLGPLQFDLGFKPPKGIGLSLDVGGFKGGGFLMLDHEKGEYAGALELDFKGIISIKAIGIINTKMPDGSKGFSLLIVIAAEFTPIQLSFGFTLNGVGGIFGLNRMINVAALADGIRTNAVKSILFPRDVIANITRIISDIKQFFPPQQDHFVVGPMAKLGWGTPSIITVELGLLLDLPNPMFAIVGVLKAMLPAEDAPLLRLQVNFIGIVDFDRGYIFFRADLFDSRLLVYSITGSMAFLVSWGEAQTFALSVGGFHPDFRDIPSIPALPDGFRNMARIGLSLLSDDNPRIKVESYFAVTSNTVQFGARVELYASAGGFNIYGFLGYDVLFQFDPFRFLANISGGVALRRGTSTIAGINVSATLSGPTPWDARGKASISFFFFSISVGFHVTWGDPPPAISPATEDLLALLQREFNDTRNWRAELPPNNHLHVSLRKIEPPVGQELLVIHPAGVLTFSQRSLPLEDYLIQKFGNKKPLAQNKFKLSNANSGGPDIPADYQGVREQFAPGNFTELSDSEKLSRRSFEKLPSGFKLTATNDLLVATPVTRSVVYELSYLRRKSLVFKGLITLVVKAYDRLVKGSSVRQSTLAHQQNRLSLNAPKQVILPEEGFAIASTADLKSHLQNGDGAVVFATQAEAYQRQSELIAQNPSLAGSLQVVSNFELNLN